MATHKKHYSITESTIDLTSDTGKGKVKTLPLLKVEISGKPGLTEILTIMRDINKEIENIKGDYISMTDLTGMDINNFLGSIILRTMEPSYKSLVSVKRPSLLSFVVLGENEYHGDSVVETLQTVNNASLDKQKNYNYRYVFVRKISEVAPIASKLLL